MKPVTVNTPDLIPMIKVRVMTAKDYSDEALKTLHRAGVLRGEESEKLRPINREAIEHERRGVLKLLTNIVIY